MIGPGLADKAAAILRRDVFTAMRYRSASVLTIAGVAAELAAFYYLAKAIGPSFRPEGTDYFSFLVVGTGFYTFLVMGIHSFLHTVQEAQQGGTFEFLMTTPTAPSIVLCLSALSAFSRNAVQFVLYLGAGLLLLKEPLRPRELGASVMVFLLSVAIAVAIGMMAAALQVATQKGSVILWALGSGAWLLTGTLFPVADLPRWLRSTANLIPLTHALNAMRSALLEGSGRSKLLQEIGVLAAFCLVLLPLGLLSFSYSLRRARLQGTLSSY
ncbi:MAG TPA: ABC transporter permease [Terriglobales bacterium]|nr:ABC transporter permease [Terriglobales bacterium]